MSKPPTIDELFDHAAGAYDSERQALIPCFEAFYAAALAPLGALPYAARVLDLGAGTGLFAGLLRAAKPDVKIVLCDLSPAMLERAQRRFEALPGDPPDVVVADYAKAMPDGPFDAVISALSIHHLEDAEKARVAETARRRLRPGGVFVNAEQIAGETEADEARLDRDWEAAASQRGASADAIARARTRMSHDRCVTTSANRQILTRAGFMAVAEVFRDGRFAVFTATAPA